MKMKKQLYACMALALAFLFLFSGCSLRFTSLPNLLRPPKLAGGNEEVQDAFEDAVGKNFLLKTPSTGEYHSSFILYDMDHDGEEEALVFYTENKDQSTVRIHFMDSENGKWTFHYDFPGEGSEIYSVYFADMNDDEKAELIVGWRLFGSQGSKMLTIYQYTESENGPYINTLAREAFTAMLPVDMDADGCEEVFVLAQDTAEPGRGMSGKLLKMVKNVVTVAGEVALDPRTSNYVSLKSEKLGTQSPVRIYIDANAGASSMITEIVYWDSRAKRLIAPLYEEQKGANVATLRYEAIASNDINNDAIIEIPVQSILPDSGYTASEELSENAANASKGQATSSVTQQLYLTKWLQFQGSGPQETKVVAYSAINYSDGYLFYYPEEWIGENEEPRVTIISNQNERQWSFFAREGGQIGDELFAIMTLPADQWEKNPLADYTLLKRNDSVVYVGRLLSAASAYDIHFDLLESSISIIE